MRPVTSVGALAFVLALFGFGTPAHATYTFGITYFTISSADADFGTNPCCVATPYANEVTSTLGPDGLPVYNSSYGGPALHDVNANGELTWWSPSQNSNVTQTGTGTVTSPFSNTNFYPPNGTGPNDANGYQGAIISGTFTLPATESVTFTLGSDDDSFLYVDGTNIAQLGGIHGIANINPTTSTLTAGAHTFNLFYVDRQQTGAGLNFSLNTQGLTVTPTPEPASSSLLATAVLGLGLVVRRRRRR
jgi:MYXO-CTERM domain-containing protein